MDALRSYMGVSQEEGGAVAKVKSRKKVFSSRHSRTTVLAVRVGVGFYMLAVTILFGWGTFYLLSTYENKINKREYDGFANDLGKSSQDSLDRTFQVTKLMASITAKACPDADMWPNCSGISVPNYVEYVDSMVAINPQVRSVALNPFITSDQVSSFEAFAYKFYAEQGHGPNDTIPFGINPDFGKGIYARDSNGNLYHTTTAYTLGQHSILAPILLQGKLEQNLDSLMFNVYSETARVAGIDDMISCINASLPEDAVNCGSVTDLIRLVQDAFTAMRPAALIYFPIFPTNDPTTLVGASFSVFNWDVVLSGHLASNVKSVRAVLTTGLQTFTFSVSNTGVVCLGEGDLHRTDLSKYRRTFYLTNDQYSTLQYTLYVYPSEPLSRDSMFAIIGCILAIGIIVVTSIIVLIYDHVVLKQARARELVGETKRLFVRYVSHEIRTPLNTVHLGLVFLHSDIARILESIKPVLPLVTYDEINSWVGLVDEIEDSADVAVTVLNDLINYDKIVMGSLNLEVSELYILDCVHDTVRPFQVQARERNITLKFRAPKLDYLKELIVVVDVVKIEQVIRNLVGNALKFTAIDGEVVVTVTFVDELHENYAMGGDQISVNSSDTNPVDYDLLHHVGMIHIAVKDSGVGMSKENLANLFQEGVQFNANQLQSGKGSGLGLWVSKGFAMRHNGDIIAKSEGEGHGCVFTLILPVFERRSHFASLPGGSLGNQSAGYSPVTVLDVENGGIAFDSMIEMDSPEPAEPVAFDSAKSNSSESLKNNDSRSSSAVVNRRRSGSKVHIDADPVETQQLQQQLQQQHRESVHQEMTDDEYLSLTFQAKKSAESPREIQPSAMFKTVLVVEDSIRNRKILCRLLSNGGYLCTQAENGKVGVDLVAKHRDEYDMILMDFEMPVMDGPAATKAIRALGYTKPIVGITGNVLAIDRNIFMNAGATEVLYKPLTLGAFNGFIQEQTKKEMELKGKNNKK